MKGQFCMSDVTVGPLSSRWTLHPWHGCTREAQRFTDRTSALVWLQQLRGDLQAMYALRTLLLRYGMGGMGAHLARINDGELLQHVAAMLASGLLHAHSVAAPATLFATAAQASAAAQTEALSRPVSRVSPTPSSSAPAPPPQAQLSLTTFSAHMDAAATAVALCAAAATGAPFCEECARRAAQQTAQQAAASAAAA